MPYNNKLSAFQESAFSLDLELQGRQGSSAQPHKPLCHHPRYISSAANASAWLTHLARHVHDDSWLTHQHHHHTVAGTLDQGLGGMRFSQQPVSIALGEWYMFAPLDSP